MDNTILKKKLSTFRSSEGYLVGVSPEVLHDLLRAWESWTGVSKLVSVFIMMGLGLLLFPEKNFVVQLN